MRSSKITERFGARVRRLRFDLGLSQEELAERADLHRTYIAGIERGARNVTLKSIEKLARALGVSTADLFSSLGESQSQSAAGRELSERKFVDILLVDAREKFMNVLRILIADDHELIRGGLRKLLEEHKAWEICGEAASGRDAVEQAKRLKPDLVILDFSMPDLNGIEAAREIHRELPQTEVLILTMHEDLELIRKASAAGARGCILKSEPNAVLVDAIETVAKHQPLFNPKAAGLAGPRERKSATAKPAPPQLTPRQHEVLRLIASGKSSKEVARQLGLSTKTIETHRANLMRALGVHSVSELVLYAVRNRIVQP